MKHLQYFQTPKSASIDISLDTPGTEGESHSSNALKRYKQTLAGLWASSPNPNLADSIKNGCQYFLMFVLTGHAVVSKFKNFYEKNVLTIEDGVNILRVIFLACRNVAPVHQQKIQSVIMVLVNQLSSGNFCKGLLTQFKTIAPDLYAQFDTAIVTSETVVSALWPYISSIGMPY